VYSYDILPEAREYVDGMPAAALSFYSEPIEFMELTPWDAPPYRHDKPDGNMRKMLFGRGAEGIAVCQRSRLDRIGDSTATNPANTASCGTAFSACRCEASR
jgi:hypothetical protein